MKSNLTFQLSVAQDRRSIFLHGSSQPEPLCCCFLRDISQGVVVLISTYKINTVFNPRTTVISWLLSVSMRCLITASSIPPALLSEVRLKEKKQVAILQPSPLQQMKMENALLCLGVCGSEWQIKHRWLNASKWLYLCLSCLVLISCCLVSPDAQYVAQFPFVTYRV